MIIDEADYIRFSHNAERFLTLANPGPYPINVDADAAIRERQVDEHKVEIVKYETLLGVKNFLCRRIVKCVDHEWIAELESQTMGFNHVSPKQILDHLCDVSGTMDHVDVANLTMNLQQKWDGIETPAAHFARGDKYERQLEKSGLARNPNQLLAFALATFQEHGEYETSIHEWEAKPAAEKTFKQFQVFIQKEYATRHKHNKATAKSVGHGIANSVTDEQANEMDHLEAQALLLAEMANSMQEQQNKQFMQMMEVYKTAFNGNKNVPAPNANTGRKKKKKCLHCELEVYHKPEKCFELEANASKQPANWKSKKST
jgi:hypothetical protein